MPTKSATEWLQSVVRRNRRGEGAGICSICSANPWVLEASLRQALEDGTPVLIESTSNQVNQEGGYTGHTPRQFAEFVGALADGGGFPRERVLLGGDHLGPYPWRREPAAQAMANACELVRQCVAAGYTKIHLDASMRCGDDPEGALDPEVIAARAAELCQAAEAPRQPDAPAPVYIIGTEVPVPGGEQNESGAPSVTATADAGLTLEQCRAAFAARGLEDAFARVVGLVVQPGVEFGDALVFEYDRAKAGHLSAALPATPELVYEAHSTDYQPARALRELVEDHFAILKVGPWLTFAFREAVFALAALEHELLGERRGLRLSRVGEALEQAMLKNPAHWQDYYRGDEAALRLARRYSYSDRCRYYWPEATVQAELNVLLANLTAEQPPLTLLSQFLPAQYAAVRAGMLANRPGDLIRDRVRDVLRVYSAACGSAVSRAPISR